MPVKTLCLAAALLCGVAAAVERPNCAPYNDPNRFYFDTEGRILYPGEVNHNPYRLTPAQQAQLRRLVALLKARGTTLMILPVPEQGFTLAGKLNAKEIAGTKFAITAQPDYVATFTQNYRTRLQQLNATGALGIDYLGAALTTLKTPGSKLLYFKLDGHWTVDGSGVAAAAAGNTLRRQRPDVATAVKQADFTVSGYKHIQYPLTSFPALIKKDCPTIDFKSDLISFDTPLATRSGDVGLLDDDHANVLLLGSSLSSDYLGLAEQLKVAFGSEVDQISVSRGALFGSMREYFLTAKPAEPTPKVIVWEYPDNAEYLETEFRQLFPVAQPSTRVGGTRLGAVGGERSVPVPAGVRGERYFVRVTFDSYLTREVTVVLGSGAGAETVRLAKDTASAPKAFQIELQPGQAPDRVTVKLPAGATGGGMVEFFKYQ